MVLHSDSTDCYNKKPPHPLVHRRHLVLLGAAGGGVTCRHPADGHLSVTFALRTLHPHKLHVVVLVEAERHPLSHLSSNAHLQHTEKSVNMESGPIQQSVCYICV